MEHPLKNRPQSDDHKRKRLVSLRAHSYLVDRMKCLLGSLFITGVFAGVMAYPPVELTRYIRAWTRAFGGEFPPGSTFTPFWEIVFIWSAYSVGILLVWLISYKLLGRK